MHRKKKMEKYFFNVLNSIKIVKKSPIRIEQKFCRYENDCIYLLLLQRLQCFGNYFIDPHISSGFTHSSNCSLVT